MTVVGVGDASGDAFVIEAQRTLDAIRDVAVAIRREVERARGVAGDAGRPKGERAAAALILRGKQRALRAVLRTCEEARQACEDAMRAGDDEGSDAGHRRCLRELAAMLRSATVQRDATPSVGAESSAARGGAAGPSSPFESSRADVLSRVVADLEAAHASLGFQRKLLAARNQVSAETGYSAGNFAYGTTPLSSFEAAFALPPVCAAVASARTLNRRCTVWGASTGWLCFYAHLREGLDTCGVELLAPLVDVAEAVAARHGLGVGPGAPALSFVQGDLLDAPLGPTEVLVLTSQCWDADLRARAGAKIRAELGAGRGTAAGAPVVVDYGDWLREYLGPPVAACKAPVSWNPDNTFYVFAVPQDG